MSDIQQHKPEAKRTDDTHRPDQPNYVATVVNERPQPAGEKQKKAGESAIAGLGLPAGSDLLGKAASAKDQAMVDLGDGNKLPGVTKDNCSAQTKDTWKRLSELPNSGYNCEFAVLAHIDPNVTNIAKLDIMHVASMTIPGVVRQSLKDHGWKKTEENLESSHHKAGEVVMVADKEGRPHAAIVSKISADGHIQELEQKPNPTDPPVKTSLEQFKKLYQPAKVEIYQK